MPHKKTSKSEEKPAKSKQAKASEKIEEKTHENKPEKAESKEIREKILELAKKGLTSEKIGLELKKQGIFVDKSKGKRIGDVLKSQGMPSNADILNLEKKVETLKKHLSAHKQDFQTKRSLLIKEANLNKLRKLMQKKR